MLVCLVIPTLLSSCGTNSNIAVAEKTIRAALFPPSEPAISREQISKLPYAMITARVGKGPPAVLVLADNSDGARQWMATNAVSIVTRNGRLIRTVGFPHDMRDLRFIGIDPLAGSPQRLVGTANYKITLSLDQSNNRSLLLDCSLSMIGPEKIEIVELIFETVRLEETCISDKQKNISNTYWVDAFDGYVWQSRQRWDRDQPAISLSVLKPAG